MWRRRAVDWTVYLIGKYAGEREGEQTRTSFFIIDIYFTHNISSPDILLTPSIPSYTSSVETLNYQISFLGRQEVLIVSLADLSPNKYYTLHNEAAEMKMKISLNSKPLLILPDLVPQFSWMFGPQIRDNPSEVCRLEARTCLPECRSLDLMTRRISHQLDCCSLHQHQGVKNVAILQKLDLEWPRLFCSYSQDLGIENVRIGVYQTD